MTAPTLPAKPGRTRLAWLGPAATAACGIAMLCWTWRTWPDVLVDFGRELYVPWQLALGRRLYADIAYTNGPLSPALDALPRSGRSRRSSRAR